MLTVEPMPTQFPAACQDDQNEREIVKVQIGFSDRLTTICFHRFISAMAESNSRASLIVSMTGVEGTHVRGTAWTGRPKDTVIKIRATQVRESMIQLTVGELPGTVLRTHPHGGPGERTYRKALAKPTQRCHA